MSISTAQPAWREHDWIGAEIALGVGPPGRVVSPITRCAATQVNLELPPRRDLDIPAALDRNFGHINMGIYAEVICRRRGRARRRAARNRQATTAHPRKGRKKAIGKPD